METDHVLILQSRSGSARSVSEWLELFPEYDVTVATDVEEIPDSFDLCLTDPEMLGASRDRLRAYRQSEAGTVPVLLLTTDESDEDGRQSDRVPAAVSAFVDEIIVVPADPETLRRLVEAHLRIRRIDRQLEARDHQYAELLSMIPDPVLLIREGTIVTGNDGAASLLGVAETDAVVGSDLQEYVENDADLRSFLDDVRTNDRDEEVLSLKRRDGTTLSVRLVGTTVTYDGGTAVQILCRELPDGLASLQSVFAHATEAAAHGISIADARSDDEPLVYVNPAFERITGYDASEILGRNCRFLQGKNTDERTVAEIGRAIEQRAAVSVEILNYRADGTPFWNRLEIMPVEIDGEVTHFLGLQQDVTDAVLTEQRLDVLDRTLRHNLGNRSTVIRGHAERITAMVDDDDEITDAADAIVEAVEDLIRTSEQARRFEGIIGGAGHQTNVADIAACLKRTARIVGETTHDRNIDLETPASAYAHAHESLELAFTELLTVEAVADPGPIRVRVIPGETHHEIRFTNIESCISEHELEILTHRTESPLEHPYGLELWLIRWAVNYSGGDITLDRDGETPTMVITLQAAEDPETE